MSNSAIGGLLAFVDGEIECCKDEKYRLKEKRTRLEGLRAALMAAQDEPLSVASSSSSSFEDPKSSSSSSSSNKKKKDKKRKAEETVGSENETATATATPTKKQKAKAKKEKKDPNKPSRAPSAYNFFMKKEGTAYKLANPETDQKAIMGVVGGLWKELSEEGKQPFIKQAEAAKATAAAAMEAYNQGKASAAAPGAVATADSSDSD